MTVSPEAAPDTPEFLVIDFKEGVPVKVTNKTDGTVKDTPVELYEYLNTVGGTSWYGGPRLRCLLVLNTQCFSRPFARQHRLVPCGILRRGVDFQQTAPLPSHTCVITTLLLPVTF